jgi:Clp amino terminal domain, pathogenicity island component
MFERFTQEARQIVVRAQLEARELRHGWIGTEHLLLALVTDDDVAGQALASLGVTGQRARSEVLRRVPPGEGEPTSGQIPFTPRAKRALEVSLREALSFGDVHIGPEHILLGLIADPDGIAAEALPDLGAGPEAIRKSVIKLIGRPADSRQAGRVIVSSGRGEPPRVQPVALSWFPQAGIMFGRIGSEIANELRRQPDTGDLLLVLSLATDTLGGAALRELGIEPDALWAVIERLRRDAGRRDQELVRQLEEVRGAKERAIEDEQLEQAARLRDEERQLTERRQALRTVSPELIVALRRTLGLPDPIHERL